jgi:hypothetical protein
MDELHRALADKDAQISAMESQRQKWESEKIFRDNLSLTVLQNLEGLEESRKEPEEDANKKSEENLNKQKRLVHASFFLVALRI